MDKSQKQFISEYCRQYGIAPTKLRGQNFLLDPEILQRMVDASGVKKSDTVLEVGPGFGTLTEFLAEKAKKVIAVELDDALFGLLKAQLGKSSTVKLLHADILKMRREDLPVEKKYKIVSNLPYNITSFFLRKFMQEEFRPETLTLMLQEEVANRICAKPGKMSILAVSVQFFSYPEILFRVSADNFWPEPKVHSSAVHLRTKSEEEVKKQLVAAGTDEKSFFRLIKFGFSARRKQLHNNLAGGMRSMGKNNFATKDVKRVLRDSKIPENARAQDLSLDDWFALSRNLEL